MEDDSDSEEIEVTAAEVIEKLEEAWLNEKFAPELLHSKVELVECLLEQIQEMDEKLKAAPKGDIAASLQIMELERVKFIMSSYMRRRIEKIEEFTVHILEEEAGRSEGQPSKLSPEELRYAKEFADNMESLFSSLALRHMPANMQSIDRKKVARPNLNSHVFLTVTENQDQVLVDPEEEPFDLEEGTQHIMRYGPVAPLVNSSAVKLI
ncbi:DNA replication complex GINS protein SLD5-like [Rhopilema esculentum]|uniref:DNA replication complex GINS protein SLD5-like n=1 Tax=Rhopilema esculentum TaxID=499914 RepID=UPI0031D57F6B